MRSRRLELWVDVISPNAWLAWTQIDALAAEFEVDVEPCPVLFAALLNEQSRPGPGELIRVRRWMFENCLRKARRLGVPFEPPPSHPFNPLLALRIALVPAPIERRRHRLDLLFRAVWAGGPGVEDPAAVADWLTDGGEDGAALVAAAATPEAKARLRHETERAISLGVFGVPTMRIDDQLFWGYDDFPQLRDHLAGKVQVTSEDAARWAAVQPTAARVRQGRPPDVERS